MIKYYNKKPWINKNLKADIVLYLLTYKSFKNRNLADQRAAERAHYKEQFGIISDDFKKSFRILTKLINIFDEKDVEMFGIMVGQILMLNMLFSS